MTDCVTDPRILDDGNGQCGTKEAPAPITYSYVLFLFQESNSNSSVVQTVYWSLKNKRALLAPVKDRYPKKRRIQRTRHYIIIII